MILEEMSSTPADEDELHHDLTDFLCGGWSEVLKVPFHGEGSVLTTLVFGGFFSRNVSSAMSIK